MSKKKARNPGRKGKPSKHLKRKRTVRPKKRASASRIKMQDQKLKLLFFAFFSLAIISLAKFSLQHGANNSKVLATTAITIQATQTAQWQSPQPTPLPSPKPSPKLAQIPQETKPLGFCLNVPILMYHHIQPYSVAAEKGQTGFTVDSATFDQQMAYLSSSGYRTISLEELSRSLKNHQTLGKAVAITIDDGYLDNYTYAYPVFKKYGIKANLFIPTGLLNNGDYMNWDQLKEMVSSGQVFAYNHTWSHANLGSVSEDKMKFEVLTAKQQLESNLSKTVSIFAYPYGSENQNVINFLSQNGFAAAASTIQGRWQCENNIYSLQRLRIGNSSLASYGL